MAAAQELLPTGEALALQPGWEHEGSMGRRGELMVRAAEENQGSRRLVLQLSTWLPQHVQRASPALAVCWGRSTQVQSFCWEPAQLRGLGVVVPGPGLWAQL